VCRQRDLLTDWHKAHCQAIGEPPRFHRKQWEYGYILQALEERGCLAEGKIGLGFGVGREPLAARMAALGASVVATDMRPDSARKKGWIQSNEHADSLASLRRPSICPDSVFDARARFRPVDMNAIPNDLRDFDFLWSCCALEHLGTLENGLRFVRESARCLKPGGVAVHTTEYNLDSNGDTVESGSTVLFRRRDLERLHGELADMGMSLEPLEFDPGDGILDRYVDLPPYEGGIHLRLPFWDYAITSFGLILRRTR
jgi:SAM-dependent methyltransferase